MKLKYVTSASDATLGDRQIRVIASDASPDRDGDVLVPGGCVLDNYRKNPIVLANHDKTKPIGTAVAAYQNGRVEALITFAPEGLSTTADEYCGLAKAGILGSVSVGFLPIEQAPMGQGRRGYTVTKWELLEISLVAIPANANATILQRSAVKAGRVLSGANASKLQEAHDAAETCRALVADVLGSADDDADDVKRHRDYSGGAKRRRLAIYRRALFEVEQEQARMNEVLALAPRVMTRAERQAEIRRLEMEGLRYAD